jgi:hypothetical protein
MVDKARKGLNEIQAIETLARMPFSPETMKHQKAFLASAAVFTLGWNNLANLASIGSIPVTNAHIAIWGSLFLGVYWFIRFFIEARVEAEVAEFKREVLVDKILKKLKNVRDLFVSHQNNIPEIEKVFKTDLDKRAAFYEWRESRLREIKEEFAPQLTAAKKLLDDKTSERERASSDPKVSQDTKIITERAWCDAAENQLALEQERSEAEQKVYNEPLPHENIDQSFLALFSINKTADEFALFLRRVERIIETSKRRQRVTKYFDIGVPVVAMVYILLCSTWSFIEWIRL